MQAPQQPPPINALTTIFIKLSRPYIRIRTIAQRPQADAATRTICSALLPSVSGSGPTQLASGVPSFQSPPVAHPLIHRHPCHDLFKARVRSLPFHPKWKPTRRRPALAMPPQGINMPPLSRLRQSSLRLPHQNIDSEAAPIPTIAAPRSV